MAQTRLGLRSWLNLRLRSLARLLPPGSRVRRAGARTWDALLRRTGRHVTLPIQGYPVRLVATFRSFALDYESDALRSFLRLVAPGDVVWDVGANLGIYTMLAGLRIGEQGQVVAWEPSPPNYRLLQDHLRTNGLKDRCKALKAVVHDGATTRAHFVLVTGAVDTIGRLAWCRDAPLGTVIEVEADSLDGWCRRLGRCPAVVKIDIEGAEVLALRGAAELMNGGFGQRPLLLLALHPQFLGEFGCGAEEVARLLAERGYGAFDLQGREATPMEYREYWLVPGERRGQVQEVLREHA